MSKRFLKALAVVYLMHKGAEQMWSGGRKDPVEAEAACEEGNEDEEDQASS